jgi:hypothetical protein
VRGLKLGVALAVAAISASATSTAQADEVYWINHGADLISHALVPEGGGADLPVGAPFVDNPDGLALDPAAGRIYWLNSGGGGSIGYWNFDGSGAGLLPSPGATFANPAGIAIDPQARRVYWGNPGNGTIGYASLDGGADGTLATGTATAEPNGLAIDPARGLIYWTNFGADRISYARLDGSGGGDVDTGAAPIDRPEGIAINPATGQLFWTNREGNSIGYADPNGGGGGRFMPTIGMSHPLGIAFAIHYGGMFWANEGFNSIEYSNGAAGGNVQPEGATLERPAWPAIVANPGPLTLPVISGSSKPGSTLTCANGEWFPDLPGSFLFQAPEPQRFSYEWERDERPVPGATASTLRADEVGRYKCRVYAWNAAGRGDAPSRLLRVSASLKLGRVRLHPASGTATLSAGVTGTGPLVVTGKGLARVKVKRAKGTVRLRIRAVGRWLRALERVGHLKVRARVAFTPAGGRALRAGKRILLRKRRGAG